MEEDQWASTNDQGMIGDEPAPTSYEWTESRDKVKREDICHDDSSCVNVSCPSQTPTSLVSVSKRFL